MANEDFEFFAQLTELLGLECVNEDEYFEVSMNEKIDDYLNRIVFLCRNKLYDDLKKVKALKSCDPKEVCNTVLNATKKFE